MANIEWRDPPENINGMTKDECVAELLSRDCTKEKREDRHGYTKTGWWCDGVYLAPSSDPKQALRILMGGG